MTGSRAWRPWDLQRPWPASQDVHHLCMILITRHEKTPWASTVVAFLSEPPIDIVTVCDEPQGYYMRLWDSGEGVVLREIRLLDAQEEVHAVQVSGSGDAIAIGHGPGHLQVCHYRQGRLETFHKQLGTTGLTQLAFQRDGPMLAAIAGDSGDVYIIDMFTQVCCHDRQMVRGPDHVMTWSPCGKLLAIGATFDLLTIYDDEEVYRYCEYTRILNWNWIVALGFSNEGDVLAIGGGDCIKLFKAEAPQSMRGLQHAWSLWLEDEQYADAIEWLPHGYAFVALLSQHSFSDDGYQTMTTAGCCLQIFADGAYTDVVPDGAYWHCVRTVNMQPGLQVHCFAIHTYGHTWDGAHFWDGMHIVTAAEDGMHFWDMGSGLRLLKPPFHFSETLARDFSQVLAVRYFKAKR